MSLSGMVETPRLQAKHVVISRPFGVLRINSAEKSDSLIVGGGRQVIVGFLPTCDEPPSLKLGVSQFAAGLNFGRVIPSPLSSKTTCTGMSMCTLSAAQPMMLLQKRGPSSRSIHAVT